MVKQLGLDADLVVGGNLGREAAISIIGSAADVYSARLEAAADRDVAKDTFCQIGVNAPLKGDVAKPVRERGGALAANPTGTLQV